MIISYNAQAMLANNYLSKSDSALSASIQRLSSGIKISGAKDNPSGLAMAKRMNSQIEGLSVAKQNLNIMCFGKNLLRKSQHKINY